MPLGRIFHIRRSAAIAAALTVIAIASIGAGAASAADDGKPANRPGVLNSALDLFNLKTSVGPTPGFVEATHPDPKTLKFIPTGTPHPKRAVAVKSTDDIEAAKAALDAARDAQIKPKSPTPSKSAAKPKFKSKLKKSGQTAAGN